MAYAKVTITKFENCDANADYPVKMTFQLGESDGMQVLKEGTFSSKVPLGKNIKVKLLIQIIQKQKIKF